MSVSAARDRSEALLELSKTPWPAPPLNLFMTGGYVRGVINLSWDNPAQLMLNSRFQLLGVNIWRSFDSEYGPYSLITELPVGSTFWVDQTDNELIMNEDVSDRFILRGEQSASGNDAPRWVFTTHNPIVKEGSQAVPANSRKDVRVFIDGVEARILTVHGETGEVEIDGLYYPEVGTQKLIAPIVPTPDSVVTCTYRRNRSLLRTDLVQRVFYIATSIGIPMDIDPMVAGPGDLIETPLDHGAFTNNYELEKLDYIWAEAIRRNRWILDQGGERVKIFMRKQVGLRCPCYDVTHKQPISDCLLCFGTSVIGGYEGPYDITIGPDDAEKKISQKDRGRTVEHIYDVFTGPHPLISHRDFVVKINGDRYSIGPSRMPTNRGAVLQQHFTINHLDETDIRYKVPVGNPIKFVATEFKPEGVELGSDSSITNNPVIPEERQIRGRTITWRNIIY